MFNKYYSIFFIIPLIYISQILNNISSSDFVFFSFSHTLFCSTVSNNDSSLIDALPGKPKVNQQALDNALKKNINTKIAQTYNIIFLTIISLLLYSLSFYLAKFNLIKKATHRKIWNVILLILAIIAIPGGFLITLQLKYNFLMSWYKNLMFWHVEAGIPLTIIALFHIWWHRNYFMRIFYEYKTEN